TMFLAARPERSAAAGGMQGTARSTGQTAGAVLMTASFTLTTPNLAPRIGLIVGASFALIAGMGLELRRRNPPFVHRRRGRLNDESWDSAAGSLSAKRPWPLVRCPRDKDLDGAVDQTSTSPMPVSGICANGVVSCQPDTWNQCHSYKWDVGSSGDLKLTEVGLTDSAGCYCINNSCGANLVWGNLASVSKDRGG
ncbi:hypothetical protein OY671_008706, partial [Metschnikowia pulcherrima]